MVTPAHAQVPDVARVELQHDDEALIIASDGLWDVVADQEAADIVGDVLAVRHGLSCLSCASLQPFL